MKDRIGRVFVHWGFSSENYGWRSLRPLFQQGGFVPYSIAHDQTGRPQWCYIGYSNFFDEIEEGGLIPEYKLNMELTSPDENGIRWTQFVSFERVKE